MQRVGTTIYWNIVESGVKHYKPQLPEGPVYRVHFIYEEFLTKIILYLAMKCIKLFKQNILFKTCWKLHVYYYCPNCMSYLH
jgi:hypothetical protein